jgi:predicted transcriptional regulator
MMDTISGFRTDVLISIRPVYASKILDGEKTVELRRKFPERTKKGTIMLIYSSSPVRAIVGYTRIKEVMKLPVPTIWKEYGAAACISKDQFDSYFAGLRYGFAIVLENVRPLKKRVLAKDLELQFGIVPPQSYRYVTEGYITSLNDGRVQTTSRHERRNRARGRSAGSGVSR